ncbi:MAG TPA: DUF3175 domain-containing protein [Nitrospira sp.]|nr:DUF3175 domain-containing protein [Nitrospira sp.]
MRRKTANRPRPRKKIGAGGRRRYWSAGVMQRSDALDLERGVFRLNSPRQIAASLKRSSERSRRRKGTPYQSAMSMLNFYIINRAGRTLSPSRKRILERAKPELRKAFGRAQPR